MQDCSISISNISVILQPCTKLSKACTTLNQDKYIIFYNFRLSKFAHTLLINGWLIEQDNRIITPHIVFVYFIFCVPGRLLVILIFWAAKEAGNDTTGVYIDWHRAEIIQCQNRIGAIFYVAFTRMHKTLYLYAICNFSFWLMMLSHPINCHILGKWSTTYRI